MSESKILLAEQEIPRQWYNIQADMSKLRHRPSIRARKPAVADDFAPLFPPALIEQEMSTER